MGLKMKIVYILSEDASARRAIAETLGNERYMLCECKEADEFREKSKLIMPDLILLDPRSGNGKGQEPVFEIRAKCRKKFFVVLVMPDMSAEEMISAFENGADDFITDPYNSVELLARVNILLENKKLANNEILEQGQIRLNPANHEVFADKEKVYLTFKEYQLLFLFMRNPDNVLTKETIMRKIFGKADQMKSRSADMLVCNLRRKLGEQGSLIRTVRSVGYIMVSAEEMDGKL